MPAFKIPIGEEVVTAQAEPVVSGQVHVRIYTVSQEEPVQVDLRREEFELERCPVDIEVSGPPPRTRWEDDTLVIPVVEERLVVERRLYVREELRLRRRVTQHPYVEIVERQVEQAEVRRWRTAPDPSSLQPASEETTMRVVIGTYDHMSGATGARQELEAAGYDNVQVLDASEADQIYKAGIPDESVDEYRGELARGRSLVVVRCDEEEEAAVRAILQGSPSARLTGTDQARTDQTRAGARDTLRVPVVEEQIKVGKVEQVTGGVRVRTHVEQRPVAETVVLRDEDVTVQRRRVDRPAEPGETGLFEEREIRVEEIDEVPVIKKEARVVEEIEIRKESHQRQETVRDTARRTAVEVEDLSTDEHLGEDIQPATWEMRWRQHFQTNYATGGARWEDWLPAYRLGYDLRRDPQYRTEDWSKVEGVARQRWIRSYDVSLWDRIRLAVRHAFEGRDEEDRYTSAHAK